MWRRAVVRHSARGIQTWICGIVLWLVCGLSPAQASAPCSEGLFVEWRFHASAPIMLPPATGPDEQTVVTSVDGYVHAIASRGRFLWSYTLDAPAVAVQTDERGRVYAVSERGLLYVLRRSGAHAWGSRLPAPMLPTGPAAFSSVRGLLYVPSALNLYAFSAKSGLLWRAFLGSSIRSGPVLDSDGRAWVITRDGDVHGVESPHKRVRFSLFEKEEQPSAETTNLPRLLSAAKGRLIIIDAEGLTAYSATGERLWTRSGVRASASNGSVVRIGDAWHWLDETTGVTDAEHALDLASSARPEPVDDWLFVPTESGRLYALSRAGEVRWCDLASAPLLRPVYQRDSRLIVTAAGDGSVAAVRLRSGAP